MSRTPSRLGDFELVVCLAMSRLGEDAYGASLARVIEDRTGRSVSLGAVYKTLERLGAKGYCESEIGEPRAERGGRRRKHYRLTKTGQFALERTLADLDALRSPTDTSLEHPLEQPG